jgi:transposase InsO family protein
VSNTTASVGTLASVSTTSQNCLRKSIVEIKVNGTKLNALIDTGSSLSFINHALVEKCRIKSLPYFGKIAMANSSLSAEPTGRCNANIEIEGYTYKGAAMLIMKNLCSDVIIGHNILQRHSSVNIAFQGPQPPLEICSLAIAKVPPISLFTNLASNCTPIATRSRRHSNENSQFMDSEIKRLLREKVIEPSNSPWRAQAFVVRGENHKARMVIDYSQTINKFTMLDAYPLPRIEEIITKVSVNEVFSTIDLKSAYHQIPILESEKKYTAFEACGKLYQFLRVPFGVTNGVACFQRIIDQIVQDEHLEGTFPYLDDVTICGRTQEEHDRNLEKFLAAAEKYNLTLNKEKCKFSVRSVTLLGYVISNKTIKPDPNRLQPLLDLPIPQDTASLRRALGMLSHYCKWIPRFSERVRPLLQKNPFPLSDEAISAFKALKDDVAKATMAAIQDDVPFRVETDASDFAIAATLSQAGRPIAFFSRTLNKSELQHSSIEKEAYAIVESLRYWRHYLIGHHFEVITDQRSVSFMFNQQHSSKIKNEKIIRWRLELACFKFDIIYRPGSENVSADALSRISAAVTSGTDLGALHVALCHPGITRLSHWVRVKNLPFSIEDVKKVTNSCQTCAELKPRFHRVEGNLIKATSPFERLNLDFKGPLPTKTRNQYLLIIVDEFSRFPFAIPCADVSTPTVIQHLSYLFSVFGTPAYIHSDRGASFMSHELKSFLTSQSIATSRTTPYNPRENGQVERYNGIIWKTIMLALRTNNIKTEQWEKVLDSALHSIRSLLCTATNATPHERMFNHPRRSFNGSSLPTWLTKSGPVLMKKHVRNSKYDTLVEEVELIEANPEYAYVRLQNGRETTVSTRHLAPRGEVPIKLEDSEISFSEHQSSEPQEEEPVEPENPERSLVNLDEAPRTARSRHPPAYLLDYVTDF